MLDTLRKVKYILSDQLQEFVTTLLFFMMVTIIDIFGIGLIYPFFSLVSGDENKITNLIISGLNKFRVVEQKQMILISGLLLIVIFALQFLMYYWSQWNIKKFTSNSRQYLVDRLMNSYIYAPYSFHLTKNSSAIINHIINQTQSFALFLSSGLRIITSSIVLIGMLSLLFLTNPSLLLLISAVFLPAIILAFYFSRRIKRWGKRLVIIAQQIIKEVNHAIGGIKDVKIIGAEEYFLNTISNHAGQHAQLNVKVGVLSELPSGFIRFSLIVLVIFIALINVFFADGNQGSNAGTLAVFAVASLRVVPSMNMMIYSFSSMKQHSYAVDVIYKDLIDTRGINADTTQQIDFRNSEQQKFEHMVTVESISYRYPGTDGNALADINLNIRKGESIAFIGKSGAGKTTLVDVLLGLLEATGGNILMDGKSIYENLSGWQNNLGYIPQSIFLTDESLKKNIAFGVAEDKIDESIIESVIDMAQLRELINTLPRGVDTIVGERGVRLSGGQRQRVGIARALYHQRDILILDEATSALDNETEKLISESIQSLSGDKTLIIIAHRLSTVEDCDRLYLLDKGRIIDQGTFDEVVLHKAGKSYK